MKYIAIAAAVIGLAAINTAGTAKAEDFGVSIRAGDHHDNWRHGHHWRYLGRRHQCRLLVPASAQRGRTPAGPEQRRRVNGYDRDPDPFHYRRGRNVRGPAKLTATFCLPCRKYPRIIRGIRQQVFPCVTYLTFGSRPGV